MEVYTLLDNVSSDPRLIAEHGLSLYIETKGLRILFDCGQSDAFAKNAEAMGIDLSLVDLMVLSHGHYDHGGGLRRFLELNEKAPIYLSPRAFEPHYRGTETYIGLDQTLRDCPRFRPVDQILRLHHRLTIYPAALMPTPFPAPSYGLNLLEDGQFRPDDFLHEQYLLIEEDGKDILFSGCSHRGILNLADCFQPDVLIGGFHFKKLDPQSEGRKTLEEAAQILSSYPIRYGTGHCTGAAQYEFLHSLMGDQVKYLSVGTHWTL